MICKPVDAAFRQKVRERYDQAMAKIDPIIDSAIRRTRTQIGRPEDPANLAEIQKMLETVVAVYTANCGPLDASSAALLMLKAIRQTLCQEQEVDWEGPRLA